MFKLCELELLLFLGIVVLGIMLYLLKIEMIIFYCLLFCCGVVNKKVILWLVNGWLVVVIIFL